MSDRTMEQRRCRAATAAARAKAAQDGLTVGQHVEWLEAGLYRWATVVALERGMVCLRGETFGGEYHRILPVDRIVGAGSL